MFMLLHRYKFESNSQQEVRGWRSIHGCLCYYIDTSLKAIHNHVRETEDGQQDVYAIT